MKTHKWQPSGVTETLLVSCTLYGKHEYLSQSLACQSEAC